jgi:hypothetical protein
MVQAGSRFASRTIDILILTLSEAHIPVMLPQYSKLVYAELLSLREARAGQNWFTIQTGPILTKSRSDLCGVLVSFHLRIGSIYGH